MCVLWLLKVHRLRGVSDAASQADKPGNTIELRGRLNASECTLAGCNNGLFRSQCTDRTIVFTD